MSDVLCVLQMIIVLSVMIDNVAKKIQEIQNDDFFSSWVLLIKHTVVYPAKSLKLFSYKAKTITNQKW